MDGGVFVRVSVLNIYVYITLEEVCRPPYRCDVGVRCSQPLMTFACCRCRRVTRLYSLKPMERIIPH